MHNCTQYLCGNLGQAALTPRLYTWVRSQGRKGANQGQTICVLQNDARRRDLHLAHRRSQLRETSGTPRGNEVCRLGEVDRMKAMAIKKDQTQAEATANFQAMAILRCDACDDDFVIYHSQVFVDKSVAGRQA